MCKCVRVAWVGWGIIHEDSMYAVVTVCGDEVAEVVCAISVVNRQGGRCCQVVRGTPHATFGTGWFILFDGNGPYSSMTVYPCVRGEDLLRTL